MGSHLDPRRHANAPSDTTPACFGNIQERGLPSSRVLQHREARPPQDAGQTRSMRMVGSLRSGVGRAVDFQESGFVHRLRIERRRPLRCSRPGQLLKNLAIDAALRQTLG